MLKPFVHEMGDGRIDVLVTRLEGGLWAMSVWDRRMQFSRGTLQQGFTLPQDALMKGCEYVRRLDPGHDCERKGCHFGFEHLPGGGKEFAGKSLD